MDRFFLTAALCLRAVVLYLHQRIRHLQFDYAANACTRGHRRYDGHLAGMIGLASAAPDFFSAFKILLVVVFCGCPPPVASHMLLPPGDQTDEQRTSTCRAHGHAQAGARGGGCAQEAAAKRRGTGQSIIVQLTACS